MILWEARCIPYAMAAAPCCPQPRQDRQPATARGRHLSGS
jgi:hypothetical protein